ncbi:hypothetical protein TURU_079600 [Turdus rufiventris]|nr:hypothetical protein TURU_079600 [Turdus rufiventris]
MKLGKGVEQKTCEEQLRDLGVFSLEETQGDLFTLYNSQLTGRRGSHVGLSLFSQIGLPYQAKTDKENADRTNKLNSSKNTHEDLIVFNMSFFI